MAVGTSDARLVERLLAEGEVEWVEFKESWFDPTGIGRYVSALGNGARLNGRQAGYLAWGVSNNGDVVGTTFDQSSKTVGNQPFEFWLKGRITPAGHAFRFIDVALGDRKVVILEVQAAQGIPIRFDGLAYIRVGSATPRLDEHPDRERRLLALLVESSFESDVAMELAKPEEVDELLDLESGLRLLERPPKRTLDERLNEFAGFRLLEAAGPDAWHIPNRTALLFARRLDAFGHRFERRVPRVVFYEGDNRVTTRFEQTGVQGYAIGFEGLFKWLEDRLPRNEQLHGVLRRDHPLSPLDALRELVANALIHQDLTLTGAGPMIEVFDNRLEISNPGQPLIDVDRLLDESPRSRNEFVAHLMRHMGFCEERGSGIDKVVFHSEVWQLPPPAFELKSSSFVATMFAPRSFAEMTPEERTRACYQHASLLWASGTKAMTNATLRQRFGLAASRASQISRVIGDALGKGVIKDANPSNKSRAQASYLPYWA